MLTKRQLLFTLDQGELPSSRRRQVPRNGPDYTIMSQFGFAKCVVVSFSRFGSGVTGVNWIDL